MLSLRLNIMYIFNWNKETVKCLLRNLSSFVYLQFYLLQLRTCFSIDEDLRKTRWPPTCPLNHLKEVTITGLKGHSSEIAIAIYLLKNAIALEKMTVDPRQRIYLGNGKCGLLEEACENWSRVGRQRVRFQLEQEVSSLVELSIL